MEKLKEICDKLNTIWSEKYVHTNDDLGYIKASL